MSEKIVTICMIFMIIFCCVTRAEEIENTNVNTKDTYPPHILQFPKVSAGYTIDDIVNMTQEEKLNLVIVFIFLAYVYNIEEIDLEKLYKLLPEVNNE